MNGRGLYAAALLCALSTACTRQAPEAPIVNSRPARLLRVHGSVAPALSLRVQTQYLGTEESCHLENAQGRRVPPSQWVESQVARSGDEYEAIVALDHFQQDACGWHPFVIAFQVTNAQGVTTGYFASNAGQARLVPGPENKIWISMPGQRESTGERSRRQGSRTIRPLDLWCAPLTQRGAEALSCVTDSPRELPLLSVDATDVQVNFRESRPPH